MNKKNLRLVFGDKPVPSIVLIMVFVLRLKKMRGCDNMRKTLVKREKIVEYKIELKELYDQLKFNYQPPLSFSDFLIMKIMTMEEKQ